MQQLPQRMRPDPWDLQEKNNRRPVGRLCSFLSISDRTEKGLSDRLRQAGFCAEAVEDAVAYVSSFGYVDDGRYAENYIAYRIQSKSRRKILQELLQKGVDRGDCPDCLGAGIRVYPAG